ncbi:hypothetical protein Dimus_008266 [Dionaea muscipula]
MDNSSSSYMGELMLNICFHIQSWKLLMASPSCSWQTWSVAVSVREGRRASNGSDVRSDRGAPFLGVDEEATHVETLVMDSIERKRLHRPAMDAASSLGKADVDGEYGNRELLQMEQQ